MNLQMLIASFEIVESTMNQRIIHHFRIYSLNDYRVERQTNGQTDRRIDTQIDVWYTCKRDLTVMYSASANHDRHNGSGELGLGVVNILDSVANFRK